MSDALTPEKDNSRLCSPAEVAARQSEAAAEAPGGLYDLLHVELPALAKAMGAHAAGIHLVESAGTREFARLYAHHGLSAAEEQAATLVYPGEGLLGQCLNSQQLVLRLGGTMGDISAAWEEGVSCYAVAPLRAGGYTIGCLWALAREGAFIHPEAPAVLNLMAEQLSRLIVSHNRQQQLATDLDRYLRFSRNLHDCIWMVYLEPEPKTCIVSDGIRHLTGHEPQDFIDDPTLWVNIVYPDDRDIMAQANERLTSGEPSDVHYRVRVIRKDGQLRWAHTRARAARDDIGLRLDGVTTDVTDHVRLEEKVRRADRLSAVGMLAGGIAHEYNNLHFAILGTLDLLLMRPNLEESMRGHINRVREAAERASDITNKLVGFARGGSGGREIADVSELVDSVLTLVQKEFSTRGIQTELKLSPLPLRVRCNRSELGQVLVNLIINAQQAMQESAVKRLTISTGLDDHRVYISITDTGHGITPENLPRLFDPFFTTKGAAGSWLEERAAADAYLPGRGLGLSVAQTIVHEHGGDIEVESEIDCGTRFLIYLPPPAVEGDQQLAMASPPSRHNGRILVADDEAPVRDVCRELLQSLSYEVHAATGGEEALRILRDSTFDLVLVDLQMPDMDGFELVRRINEIPIERRPAKLIITGNIDDLPPQTCTELGIAGLLQKRASLSELVSKVQLALATRRPGG